MQFPLLAGALALAFLYFPVATLWAGAIGLIGLAFYQSGRGPRRPWFPVLLVACLIVALSPQAFAADGQINVGGVYGVWRPYIVDIIGTVLIAFVGWLLAILKAKWNITIEDSRRDALQTALTNAAGLAIAKLDNVVAGKTITVGNPAVAAAVELVLKSVPDAIAYFGLTPQAIAEKIVAKIPVVANTTPATPGA